MSTEELADWIGKLVTAHTIEEALKITEDDSKPSLVDDESSFAVTEVANPRVLIPCVYKTKALTKLVWACCAKATKKIFLPFLNKVLNSCATSRRRRVYHQFRRNCISPTACRCISSSRGKCTLARDEMQGRVRP